MNKNPFLRTLHRKSRSHTRIEERARENLYEKVFFFFERSTKILFHLSGQPKCWPDKSPVSYNNYNLYEKLEDGSKAKRLQAQWCWVRLDHLESVGNENTSEWNNTWLKGIYVVNLSTGPLLKGWGYGRCSGVLDSVLAVRNSHKFLGPYVLSMVQVFRKYPWSKLDKMVAESAFDVSVS
ncbi:hypothetical protein HanRHA438_Chr03g0149981 [Helianthus annuus]|nr:hypothetical protein HanRHA438_Chr03g0149981 [Helianthus annuus]